MLVVGSAQWPKIDFVDVISWTKSEIFKVQLRDDVMSLGQLSMQPVMTALATNIDSTFERRKMSEFEYLKGEIDPPTWLLVFMALANLIFAGLMIAHYKGVNVMFWQKKSSYNRRR